MIEMRWKRVAMTNGRGKEIAFNPNGSDLDLRVLQYREKSMATSSMMTHKVDTIWSEWKDVETEE